MSKLDFWPQRRAWNGTEWVLEDVPTMEDPQSHLQICSDCWNGKHKRSGCKNSGCKCGCYRGINEGLGKAHPPTKDCEEQESLPDVGTMFIK